MVTVMNEQEEQQLKQRISEGKQWISVERAVDLIQNCLSTTTGHAQKLLKDARASGEVRYANGDGIVNDPRFDYAYRKDDLGGWLDRQFSKPKVSTGPAHRYPGDTQLLEEGRELVRGGMSKRKAAEQLAPKAKGGSIEQKIERLRKLI